MIRVGVGGWTYAPWRGSFYPKGLPQAQELGFASRHLTSIEVNGTFYRTQAPATFRKWASEAPDGFVFALKGPGYVTNRRELRESGPSIARFLESGITELGRSSARSCGSSPLRRGSSPRSSRASSSSCRARSVARRSGTPWKCGTTASRRRSSSP